MSPALACVAYGAARTWCGRKTIFTRGNGTLNDGEECDDGNTANGDFCTSTCQYPIPIPF